MDMLESSPTVMYATDPSLHPTAIDWSEVDKLVTPPEPGIMRLEAIDQGPDLATGMMATSPVEEPTSRASEEGVKTQAVKSLWILSEQAVVFTALVAGSKVSSVTKLRPDAAKRYREVGRRLTSFSNPPSQRLKTAPGIPELHTPAMLPSETEKI
jgi:hypothetical protein